MENKSVNRDYLRAEVMQSAEQDEKKAEDVAAYFAAPAPENREKNIYRVIKIHDWLYVIDQFCSLRMYFVVGSERALLIDTGYGLNDYRPLLREITDKPILVVDTHGDIDHVTGNYLFDEVHISVHDFRDLPVGDNREIRRMMYEQYTPYFKMEENMPFEEWMTHSVMDTKYRLIDEGFVFDLGDRKLEVIAVPGHTPGSIALLEKNSGYLFSGDLINGPCIVLMDLDTRTCDPLLVSLYSFRKLINRINEIKQVFPCHCMESYAPDILTKGAAMLEEALKNNFQDPEKANFIGDPSRMHWNTELGVGVDYVDHAAELYPVDAVIFD